MNNLTKKQAKDIETVKYFIPRLYKEVKITDKDIEDFLDYSEKGQKNITKIKSRTIDGFHALIEGKRWRGIHMEMYEDGVLDGSVPYYVLLQEDRKRKWYNPMRLFFGVDYTTPASRTLVDFLKKDMFKGYDANIIESVYQEIVKRYGYSGFFQNILRKINQIKYASRKTYDI